MRSVSNRQLPILAAVVGLSLILSGGLVGCSKFQSAETFISEAEQYLQKGDSKAAVIQLKNALQKSPDSAEARYLLGNTYNEIGDSQSAEKELRKALGLGMSREKVVPGLGRALLLQGQFQKVLEETDQVAVAQQDAQLSTLRGNAYLALGKLPEAKTSFERAMKEKAGYADAWIGLAKYELMQKDVSAAMRLIEQAATANPNNPDIWFFKGDLLRAQGKAEAALAAYDRVLAVKPDDAGAHIARASLAIESRNLDAARTDIEAARKAAPGSLIVYYTQALLDHTQEKHAAAWESLQQVLRAAPEHMPSLLLAGSIQLALGSTQQAEQHLKKYLATRPGDLHASKLLAATLLKNGDTERAINIVNTALKVAPNDLRLLALAGESHMKAKDFIKATRYFEQASALAPQAAPIHTALAMSRLAQGESSRAIADLELATGLDTKSMQAGVMLVMTHLRLKDFDKALSAVKALEKEQPENPLVQNLKGAVHLARKDRPAARASFEKALAIEVTYYPAAANLAQLDMQDKKPEAAKKRFEAILEKDRKNLQALAALAGLAMIQGQKKEATSWLERAARENPDDLESGMLLSGHYLRTEEKQKALTLVQKLHMSHPGNPQLLDLLAQAQLANNELPNALESYRKLAVVMPTSPAIQSRIASIHIAMQNPSAAMEALNKALSIQPDYIDAQLAQAALEVQGGRHEQALTIARGIQKQRDRAPLGHILEGDVLMSQNKPVPALKAYEQAFALNKRGIVLVKVYDSLVKAGRNKEAEGRLTQWFKENPNDTATRMHMGTHYLLTGQSKAAIEQYQTILTTEPENILALNNIALAFQEAKDPRALEYAEKASAMAPEDPTIMDTLGWVLVEQGNIKRGLPLLQRAASKAPQAPEIHYHLVLGFIKSGDKMTARKELERLLASGRRFTKMDEARALIKEL